MATGSVKVKGLRELNRAFKAMGKDVQKETREELRSLGEPVRAAAEQLSVARIRNIGDRWSTMRVGSTTKLVYVAPKARPRGTGTPRPNLAPLLLGRAMEPAVEASEPAVMAGLEAMLDRLGNRNGF